MMSEARARLQNARRWVIKIGSALLTNEGGGLRIDGLDSWAKQIYALRQQGCHVVIVSSGATVAGAASLGWKKQPRVLHKLQAAAAVGQMGLIKAWESCFKNYKYHTAQILLTHEVIADRARYLNARGTLRTLLELGVIPVVNENDTVSTEELRFGDNDTLSGLVTHLIDADVLVLLTDQAGLFDADPRRHPDAKLVSEGMAGDPQLERYAGKSSILGRGGMLTKLRAATMAAQSGACTVIASGFADDVLGQIARGEACGTLLIGDQEATLTARKRWLAGQSSVSGKLHLDQGAADALAKRGRSLLAVGVAGVEGDFRRGDLVVCVAPNARHVASGLVNYDAEEVRKIMGHPSTEVASLLGYIDTEELIHCDDLVLL